MSQKQAATERVYLASAGGVPSDAGGLRVWGMLPQRSEPVVEPPVATDAWTGADADDAGFFGGGDDSYVMDEARTRFQLDEGAKTARIVNGQIAEAKMMADARAAQETTSTNNDFAIDSRYGMRAGPTVEKALASGLYMPDVAPGGSFVSNAGGAAVGFLPSRASIPTQSNSGFGGELVSLGLDLLPIVGSIKSGGQLLSGKDLVTGEPVNRWLEAGGILLGVAPGGKALIKGEKIADLVGPVVFRAPAGATNAEIAQIKAYIEGSNEALQAGKLSPTGRVSTKGELRTDASLVAAQERARAATEGARYQGHVGHVPDTTWTGTPQPYKWLDLSPSVNSSLGGQAAKYPVGYKPTVFIFKDR